MNSCQKQDALLTSIRSDREFLHVLTLASPFSSPRDAWIGLRAVGANLADPQSYQFFDTPEDKDFYLDRETFSWEFVHSQVPSGNNQAGRCVAATIKILELNVWRNIQCGSQLAYICRRPCRNLDKSTTNEREFIVIGLAAAAFVGILILAVLTHREMKERRKQHEVLRNLQLSS